MKSVIVGTAGHIDHGKTALVKALTGIDPDRLEEEKRRGITIDLGFAHMQLRAAGTELRLGFVDVPGHERFVRNMLAGAGGIDLVLLVIAADESLKPQTREHFDICRLLNVRRGITAITKADLAPADTLEVTRLEIEDFLRGSFLEGAPIVAVSSLTGQGLERLKDELARLAAEVPARDSQALARLPIDRVFSMKGFGTVVTGTLISGRVRQEDELELFPCGRRLRVRGVQVHNTAVEEALAGQRTALNLAGAAAQDLARGMTLAPPGRLRSTRQTDAQISLLPGAPRLRNRSRVHFHCYAAETIAEVVFLAGGGDAGPTNSAASGGTAEFLPGPPGEMRPGQTAWARLRLQEPMLLLPGDRFILRQFSPVVTIGGGVVLDAAPLPGSARPERADFLRVLRTGTPSQALEARVARRRHRGLTIADAVAETGWPQAELESYLRPEIEAKRLTRFGNVLLGKAAFAALKLSACDAVKSFHDAHALAAGISKEELRKKLGLGPEVFPGLLEALVREEKLQVSGETLHLAGRGVAMNDEEAESKRQIENTFATAGLKVPALKQVLAGLKVDRGRAQQIVTLLLRDRALIKLTEELVFHRGALERLRRLLADYKQVSSKIDVAKFKELTGVSRKYAIPLLEYLDREHVTRRVGDERVIL
jgi:selenocysteine-specific elongation factor